MADALEARAVSFTIPPNCEYHEKMTTSADGREVTDLFENYVEWKMHARENTILMATQKGFGKVFETPPHEGNPEQPLYNNALQMDQVAKLFLSRRFTGPLINQMVKNLLAQREPITLNAYDIWTRIDQRYSLNDSASDPESLQRRSKMAVEALWKSAPMIYAVMEHRPIIWGNMAITEDSDMDQWTIALRDEYHNHQNMLRVIRGALTDTDRTQEVATEQAILNRLKEHPTMAFAWLKPFYAELEQSQTLFGEGVRYSAGSILAEGQQYGYIETLRYQYQKNIQYTKMRRTVSTFEEHVAEIKKPQEQRVPKNACKFHFYGDKGCKKGNDCAFSHAGPQGSGGKFKRRSELRREQQKESSKKRLQNYQNKEIKCFRCGKLGHLQKNCKSKEKGDPQKRIDDLLYQVQQLQSEVVKKKKPDKGSEVKSKHRFDEVELAQFNAFKKWQDQKRKNSRNEVTFSDKPQQISALSVPQENRSTSPDIMEEILNDGFDGDELCMSIQNLCNDDCNTDHDVGTQSWIPSRTQSRPVQEIYQLNTYIQCDDKNKLTKSISINGLHSSTSKFEGQHSISATYKNGNNDKKSPLIYPLFDSGASIHACSRRDLFDELRPTRRQIIVHTAGGSQHIATSAGRVRLWAQTLHGYNTIVSFNNVYFVPDLQGEIYINTTALRERDSWCCSGTKNHMRWTDPIGNEFQLKTISGNEYMPCSTIPQQVIKNIALHQVNGFVAQTFLDSIKGLTTDQLCEKATTDKSLTRWEIEECKIRLAKAGTYLLTSDTDPLLALHHRLGHVHWRTCAAYARENNIELPQAAKVFCRACHHAKQKVAPRGRAIVNKQLPLPYAQWSCDLYGPIKSTDVQTRYIFFFIDTHTRTIKSYPLEDLRSIPDAMSTFIHQVRDDVKKYNIQQMNITISEKCLKIRSDSATYFKSKRMKQLTERLAIKLTFSPPYTQSRNAFAERSIATIANSAKALIKASGLPSQLVWVDAWMCAIQIYDLTARNINSKSPYEMRTNTKPPLVHQFPAFGQPAAVFIPPRTVKSQVEFTRDKEGLTRPSHVGKFHTARSRPGRILTYDYETKAATILVKDANNRYSKIVSAQYRLDSRLPPDVYRDPIILPYNDDYFFTDESLAQPKATDTVTESQEGTEVPDQETEMRIDFEYPVAPNSAIEGQNKQDDINYDDTEVSDDHMTDHGDDMSTDTAQSMSQHEKEKDIAQQDTHPKKRARLSHETTIDEPLYTDNVNMPVINADGTVHLVSIADWEAKHSISELIHKKIDALMSESIKPPYSMKQAIFRFPGREDDLRKAAHDEVYGLIEKALEPATLDQITQSKTKATTLLSIYSIKFDAGEYQKMKCRCCFRGETEVEGRDYVESSTHMPSAATVRLFMAQKPHKDETASRADISQAFLRADLEQIPANENRYVFFPHDISPKDKNGERIPYRLRRSLYGMHSAGRQWEIKLYKWLTDCGFNQNKIEKAWWSKESINILVYTDDVLIRGSPDACKTFRAQMEQAWGDVRYKDLNYVLGMDVIRDSDGYLGMYHRSYIMDMIKRNNLEGYRAPKTPLPPHLQLTKEHRDTEIDPKRVKKFQSLLGQVSYLATWSRPDLSYSISCLSRVACAPKPEHIELVKRVMIYCGGTPDLCLKWRQVPEEQQNKLIVYSDASWAHESDYKSQSGGVYLFNGAPIHWYSQMQSFPALSSTEAEIIGSCTALRTLLHLRRILGTLGYPQVLVPLKLDARNAISFNKDEKVSKRNHHIGVQFERVRYHEGRDLQSTFVPTDQQLADICTKNPTITQFHGVRSKVLTTSQPKTPNSVVVYELRMKDAHATCNKHTDERRGSDILSKQLCRNQALSHRTGRGRVISALVQKHD